MHSKFLDLDEKFISFLRKAEIPFARISLFVVYFWFGFLKIIDTSPANPLVMELQQKTLPFFSFHQFIILFALFEILIGFLFLFPKLVRVVIPLFALHMLTTFLPLIFLPQTTWQSFLTPTLEGQYIIKNLVLIGMAMVIASNVKPLKE